MTTNAPTDERRQHVEDVEAPRVDERAFRQGWRIRTRLDQLLVDGRISAGEWQAATDFRAAWAIARELAKTGRALTRLASASGPDAGMVAKLAAAAKVRAVEAAIGPFATALVTASVVKDLSWAAIGRYCQRDAETVRDWTVVAIRALAAAWGHGGRRRDVQSPQQDRGPTRAA